MYSKPLYASPVYQYDGKPTYTMVELDILKMDAEGRDLMDQMVEHVGDVLLTAEVHHFCILTVELERMEQILVENEEAWGQLASAKLGAIRRLEMADALARIKERNEGLVDDVLQQTEMVLCGHRT